ncbi:Dihydrofolate reductase [Saccharopolyspora antimicrobica]|uniref:Dihydrofolate reductase n=1 Tax=Saccharopolyspora antimicrobica TaxID=455193 RepID=A0A1I5HIN8_9PSEU|nr:dihydrofolate reductase family protein [Saccharopolyspora antimicrobica]RKT85293.1 dihydrofolate reductase [Saccharopolyspora antimicrobica]SFO47721.1 Dihydrofolate reductase [Saccharopolyspora antimicrobica]
MRKLTYLAAATIDGFIASPDRSDPSSDGLMVPAPEYLPHMLAAFPEIVPTHAREALGIADAEHRHFDTVVEGRRSYEVGLRAGITNAYAHLEHYVFSRTLTESPDPGVRLVATDPVEKIRELKARPGKKIWLVGGAKLAAALRPEIDELIIKLNPVVAGAGIPLFDGEFSPERFDLTSAEPVPGGVVHLTYQKR